MLEHSKYRPEERKSVQNNKNVNKEWMDIQNRKKRVKWLAKKPTKIISMFSGTNEVPEKYK